MKHYFTTSGRTGRVKYITLMLTYPFIAGILAIFPALLIKLNMIVFNIVAIISVIIIALGICWLLFTALVRRMHDLNFSAWWLVALFWMVGFLVIRGYAWPLLVVLGSGQMVLFFCPGDEKANKFGAVPDLFGGFFAEDKKSQKIAVQPSGRIDFKL